MGCNYYAIPKVTEEQAEKIKRLLLDGKLDTADNELPRKIHIGKSAIGWRFLFNHNDWQYYGKSESSIKAFTQKCNLVDEYDEPTTHKEFWEFVESKQSKPSFKATEYSRHYEIHDGLEFSTSTDFS